MYYKRVDKPSDIDNDTWWETGLFWGPYKFVHTNYACRVKLGRLDGSCDELIIYEDMLYYDGCYYGDWSVFCKKLLNDSKYQASEFEQSKAVLSVS